MNISNEEEKNIRIRVILSIARYLLIVGIVITGFFVWLFSKPPNPIDNSINVKREVVEHVDVLDSTKNGFRVVYTTVNNVTRERLEEISKRPHIKEGFRKLQHDASLHFGGLLETDIYDFAEYAVNRVPDPDIEINNIFVEGKEKVNMYAAYNPAIPNCATWINPNTEQGKQYLKRDDIYYNRKPENRIYRYWKCKGMKATSHTDERFSHFSEDERIR